MFKKCGYLDINPDFRNKDSTKITEMAQIINTIDLCSLNLALEVNKYITTNA